MILADTDILSALAKIERLDDLFVLLNASEICVAPGVVVELQQSLALGRDFAQPVFSLIQRGRIRIVQLAAKDASFRDTLPGTLGTGERESIALAKSSGGVVLSNESRVAAHCRAHGIVCLRLPDILRAFWTEGILSKAEVQQAILDLRSKDRMEFKPSTLHAILAE